MVVLIVDDERATAEALAAALAVDGFRTRVAERGYAALTTPQAWTPHVVILDIEMPVCDGFAVAGAMRGSHRFAIVPIIAFTSLDEADVVERGKEAQIDAFCRKGNSLHTLRKLIEYLAPVAIKFVVANSGRTWRIAYGAFQTPVIEELNPEEPELKKTGISRLSQLAVSEASQIHKDVQNLSMASIPVFFNSL